MDLHGRRVVLMGLGRFGGGLGAARFLAERGARLLVTDRADAASLQASLDQLADLPQIDYRLGEHREHDFIDADLIVTNPAVKPDHPCLQAAREAGVAISSEVRLLAEHLPNRARTIGVTGTAGKSTTAAMIAHALNQMPHAGTGRTWLGGNLGGSLLPKLAHIAHEDWIVLELSSFMLEGLREDGWSPHIAVLTNFQPNHLDWHGSVNAYRNAKQAIFDFQRDDAGDIAIGGPGVRETFTCGASDYRAIEQSTDPPVDLLLPGTHNQLNAHLAAAAVKAALDVPLQRACQALHDFAGLPHRLQLIAEHNQVRYYNDSKSTTPEAANLAIDSFAPHTAHLILGGSDKGSDLTALAQRAADRCRAVYTIGHTGDHIADAADRAAGTAPIVRCGDLATALQQITRRVRPGEVVVLSPGCASYDQYNNFEQRGETFIELVRAVTSQAQDRPPTTQNSRGA